MMPAFSLLLSSYLAAGEEGYQMKYARPPWTTTSATCNRETDHTCSWQNDDLLDCTDIVVTEDGERVEYGHVFGYSKPVTVALAGTVKQTVYDGKLNFRLLIPGVVHNWEYSPFVTTEWIIDICGKEGAWEDITLPMSGGTVRVMKFACPIKPGKHEFVQISTANAPGWLSPSRVRSHVELSVRLGPSKPHELLVIVGTEVHSGIAIPQRRRRGRKSTNKKSSSLNGEKEDEVTEQEWEYIEEDMGLPSHAHHRIVVTTLLALLL